MLSFGRYKHGCEEMAETFLAQFVHKIKNGSSILVLGTEECMYPALRLGAVLEDMGQNYHVRCHATTRSPIGVCTDENYPITSGYKLNSFYDINRPTYIYNLCEYDTVVVVTDIIAAILALLTIYNDIRLAGVAWGGLAVLLQIIFALSFVFLIIFALIGFVMKKLFNIHSSLLASIFGGLGIKGELLLLLHFLHL